MKKFFSIAITFYF